MNLKIIIKKNNEKKYMNQHRIEITPYKRKR
jgi:hypothetical protein